MTWTSDLHANNISGACNFLKNKKIINNIRIVYEKLKLTWFVCQMGYDVLADIFADKGSSESPGSHLVSNQMYKVIKI